MSDITQLSDAELDQQLQTAQGSSSSDITKLSDEQLDAMLGQTSQPQPLSPQDKAIQVIGQMGKAAYNNPIMKPAMKALSDLTGSSADQAYGSLPEPQGVMEKVASGIGAAAPMLAIVSPIMDTVGGLLGAADAVAVSSGAAKALPILGKVTSFLKDSDLAKSAITGYAYGKTEAISMQAQGQPVDVNQYAQDTAKQFLLWGGLTRGGATLAAKLLPKELPAVEKFVANMPPSVKNALTPEGMGSIVGGALAGTIGAPDQQSGVAGAIVGGSLSAMNPSEQFQFKVGMGKGMGVDGISTITNRWGVSFNMANDVIKKDGFEKVEQIGTMQDKNGENAIHLAAKTQIDDYNKIWQDLHAQTQPILQEMDSKDLSDNSTISLVNNIKRLIDTKFRTPGFLSKTKMVFDSAYPSLQAIELPVGIAKQFGIAPQDFKGAFYKTSVSELQKITDPALQQKVIQAIKENQAQGKPDRFGKDNAKIRPSLSDVSFQALDELRQSFSKISQGNDPYESGVAGQAAKMISEHMKSKSPEYSNLMKDWQELFNVGDKMGETQDYQKLAKKLSNPHWGANATERINSERNLKSIDDYFLEKGKAPSKDILDQYHAYHTYANPTQEGLTKTFPIRQLSGALVGGALTPILGPFGGTVAALASWHMGSPEAWIPVLKGTVK